MSQKYIYMNKEETRVVVKNNSANTIFSGELGITTFTTSFKPLYVKNLLWEKCCNLFSDLVMIPVDIKETFNKDYFCDTGLDYVWLLHNDSVVYRVWRNNLLRNHNSSKILDTGEVMLKGIGNFPCEAFKVFKF